MPKRNISFNIDTADLAKLDEYAANLERNRSYVLNQAVKMYIADAEREAEELAEAVSEADQGKGTPYEEFFAEFWAKRKGRKAS